MLKLIYVRRNGFNKEFNTGFIFSNSENEFYMIENPHYIENDRRASCAFFGRIIPSYLWNSIEEATELDNLEAADAKLELQKRIDKDNAYIEAWENGVDVWREKYGNDYRFDHGIYK